MRKILVGPQVSMDGVIAGARRAVGGSDEGLHVRRLGDRLGAVRYNDTWLELVRSDDLATQ
jgi:hypothetical protein